MSNAMRGGSLVLLVGVAAMAGCVSDAGFRCETDEQCSSNLDGVCEPTGFCSFPDSSCETGRRYGSESAQLSDLCTNETPGADAATSSSDGAPGAFDASVTGADAGEGGDPDAAAPSYDATPSYDAGPIIVDFTPSNFDQSLLTAATNRLALQTNDGAVTIDADSGAITRMSDMADLHPIGVGFQIIDQGPGLPDIGVFTMTELDIEPGVTITVVGSNALAFAVGGDATIHGAIVLRGGASALDDAGPGGYPGGSGGACNGGGNGGGGQGAGNDVGGGGGGNAGSGGEGGARGAAAGGPGGSTMNGASLDPLAGGGGGGCGYGLSLEGVGGVGRGGALQIAARGTIRVGSAGIVTAGGGGGGGGRADGGGGGGGAGGAVLLEGGRIVINGVVAVNGGGGGAGADGTTAGDDGDPGAASSAPAPGGAAAGEGTAGGVGAAGSSASGSPGATATPPDTDNAGGGGGAGGRIRLRSNDIAHPGITSPSAGMTQVGL